MIETISIIFSVSDGDLNKELAQASEEESESSDFLAIDNQSDEEAQKYIAGYITKKVRISFQQLE